VITNYENSFAKSCCKNKVLLLQKVPDKQKSSSPAIVMLLIRHLIANPLMLLLL